MSTSSFSANRNKAVVLLLSLVAAMAILFSSTLANAQDAAPEALPEVPAEVVTTEAAEAAPTGGYVPMAPTEGKGMPTAYEDDALKSLTFQDQYSANGEYALWMHDVILLPIITGISLFVLFLMLWVMLRYRRAANPTPSKTTHNTLIEVIWMGVPAIILLVIAVPSIDLLARQYETPPEDAVTIKATGYQWYWTYSYPDHGEIEIVSNMMDEETAEARGEPYQLAVDNRMVVPAGVPLRVQTTAADVIHAFAVPSLWFKIDAVPGRLNERLLVIDEPGVYYGQCSELCGARHAYMPITVEALPMEEFAAWVRENGGEMPGEAVAETEPTEDAATEEAADENA